ncbi:MAG: putative bifunctional diguanylate cyclase/phosphodiesterase [Burkholderiales bacterium]
MTLLSDIDRGILSGARFERIVDMVLRAVPTLFGHHLVALTMMELATGRTPRTLFSAPVKAGPNPVESAEVGRSLLEELANLPAGSSIESLADHAFLAPLAARGACGALLIPVFLDARLAAILSVGKQSAQAIAPEVRQIAADIADRLSVALTAANRDQQLHVQSNFDEVTALPNRRYLQERLGQEIGRALREARGFALLFIDLDQFKQVNDAIGHAGGDAVLEQAGRRIRHCVRNEDVVARFGGDEFVLLLPAIGSPGDAARVAEKLLVTLNDPFMIRGQAHQLGATIGISMFPGDGRSADRLMRNADFAMSQAKATGRGQYAFYDEDTNIAVQGRVELEGELRSALARGELTLAYQPQVDLRTGKVSGVEALLRWTHAERGPVSPGEFIAIAEQSGLIEEIGEYVRASACRQYCAWQAQGLAPPRISVNVSAREVRRAGFAAKIRAELKAYGMRGRCLELELTEGLLADNSPQVKATLAELRALDLHLAIDDFGTGYSSMSYLRDYPFTALKIDRAFVTGLGTAPGADAIVRAILALAHGLDLEVVAEGVETALQQGILAAGGCENGQGYLWSRPVAADEFARLMRNWVASVRPPASAPKRLVALS